MSPQSSDAAPSALPSCLHLPWPRARPTCLAEQANLRAVEGHVVAVGDHADTHPALVEQLHGSAQLRAGEGEQAELQTGAGGQQGAQQPAQ